MPDEDDALIAAMKVSPFTPCVYVYVLVLVFTAAAVVPLRTSTGCTYVLVVRKIMLAKTLTFAPLSHYEYHLASSSCELSVIPRVPWVVCWAREHHLLRDPFDSDQDSDKFGATDRLRTSSVSARQNG